MKTIFTMLLFIWQLPQNLIGLLVWFLQWQTTRATIRKYKDVFVVVNGKSKTFSGISLGLFVIVGDNHIKRSPLTIQHEYGHCVQSRIMGPLYLLLVGVPSVLRAIWAFIWHKKELKEAEKQYKIDGIPWSTRVITTKINEWYYSSYPEKWADELGNVHRKYN